MYKIKIKDTEYEIVPSEKDFSKGDLNGESFSIESKELDSAYSVLFEDNSYTVEALHLDSETKVVTLEVNGVVYEVQVKDPYDQLLDSLGMSASGGGKVSDVKAPMPGLVLDISVSPGDEVTKDQPLLVLEAMKMENVIKSPAEGVIKAISVEKGQAVEKNQLLISFEK
ncbi:MAG: acetyl-CoA carboxylase biotin carboxyl carrier protein subunit [Schleiferiaceae bacterium]